MYFFHLLMFHSIEEFVVESCIQMFCSWRQVVKECDINAPPQLVLKHLIVFLVEFSIATLALGLRPRQGVTRLRAKRETWESLHMLPGTRRVWGNEPSHSQVNSHVGSWSPEKTPKSLERDCRSQNSWPWSVLYIFGKLLERRCLKWARIAHLDIWNTSYGQKNGRESNWQFDSRPLKVKNRLNFRKCRKRVT
jgi:hypothetical protein